MNPENNTSPNSTIKQETAEVQATAFFCRNIYKYNDRPGTADFLPDQEF
jgi:hypothetical protein